MEIINQYQKALVNTQKKLRVVENQIKMNNTGTMLEKCNCIVGWDDTLLTIEADEDRKPRITFKSLPTQFTKEMAMEICKNVTNGHQIHPRIFTIKEYYEKNKEYLEKQLAEIELIIDALECNLKTN
jgi:hypothetical protein